MVFKLIWCTEDIVMGLNGTTLLNFFVLLFCSVQTFKGYQWNLCSHCFSSLIYRDSHTPNQWNWCSYCFLFVSIETQVDVSEEIKRINQTAEPLLSLFLKCFFNLIQFNLCGHSARIVFLLFYSKLISVEFNITTAGVQTFKSYQ